MSDPVNQALVDFMKDCILFHEAVYNTRYLIYTTRNKV